jgi:DNA (cytosine-5)-methyltransferase 1
MQARFTFADLFAGIGGMRLAAEAAGGHCVLSSEIDRAARLTYAANFREEPRGDVREVKGDGVPTFDLLLAGFPCQPFSISGRQEGFDDIRGTLFFEVARLVEERRPAAVVLENVKNLVHHQGGRTLARIMQVLREKLGYHAEWRLLNATSFGLPQARERVIIVATRDAPFAFPDWKPERIPSVAQALLPAADAVELDPSDYTLLAEDMVKRSKKTGLVFCGYRNRPGRKAGTRPGTEHLSRVHKQPNRIYRSDGTHPTLSAGEISGRYWVLHEGKVRSIGIDAAFRLQGFPANFRKPCTPSQTYKQIGNSVPVPMLEAVIRAVAEQAFAPGLQMAA